MEPISNDAIRQLLTTQLNAEQITVEGDGYNYKVTIVSNEFAGLNTLKRHKMVYAVLSEPISQGILHALTIQAQTPQEAATD